jgi:hypothetical protein
MQLTFLLRVSCMLCGCRLTGVRVGSYRINKHSIVPTSSDIQFMERFCPECRWPNDMATTIVIAGFTDDSKQRFNDYRDRKGWVRAA